MPILTWRQIDPRTLHNQIIVTHTVSPLNNILFVHCYRYKIYLSSKRIGKP